MTDPHDGALAGPRQSVVGPESRLADRTLAGRAERQRALFATSGDDQDSPHDDAAFEPEEEEPYADAGYQPEQERAAPIEPYRGETIRADKIGLLQIADIDGLAQLARPSLLVVGGTAAAARGLATRIAEARRVAIREIRVEALSIQACGEVVTALDEGDVLFIPAIDHASAQIVDLLRSVMNEYALDVTIGRGPQARSLRLELKRFFILARSGSGRVPEPLSSWGGLMVLSWETKACPCCAEEVRGAALVCRFCGHEFAQAHSQ
jgi:hypothetical protein